MIIFLFVCFKAEQKALRRQRQVDITFQTSTDKSLNDCLHENIIDNTRNKLTDEDLQRIDYIQFLYQRRIELGNHFLLVIFKSIVINFFNNLKLVTVCHGIHPHMP